MKEIWWNLLTIMNMTQIFETVLYMKVSLLHRMSNTVLLCNEKKCFLQRCLWLRESTGCSQFLQTYIFIYTFLVIFCVQVQNSSIKSFHNYAVIRISITMFTKMFVCASSCTGSGKDDTSLEIALLLLSGAFAISVLLVLLGLYFIALW